MSRENLVAGDGVVLGEDVEIGANVVIHAGTVIGDGVVIQDNVVLGKQPRLGKKSTAKREPAAPLKIGSGTAICAGAVIFAGSVIGDDCVIGDQTAIRERVTIGDNVIVGRGSLVENDTSIGDNTKIQANVYITAYSLLEDNVFIAPCVATTNDNFMGRTEARHDFVKGPTIRRGARVGGACILLPGIEIGEEAFIAAGALVTKDVPAGKLLKAPVDLPRAKGELEVERILGKMAGKICGTCRKFAVGDSRRRVAKRNLRATRLRMTVKKRRNRCDEIRLEHISPSTIR